MQAIQEILSTGPFSPASHANACRETWTVARRLGAQMLFEGHFRESERVTAAMLGLLLKTRAIESTRSRPVVTTSRPQDNYTTIGRWK